MRKVCKMMLILLTLFFVCSCDRVKGNYNNTKMVSSEVETKFYKNNDGSLGNNDVLKANVMIYNTNYSSFLGVKYKESSTYGSGVIFKTDDNYYYVLTNNHVICKESSYSNQSIYIEDYFFNRYNGEVVYSKASYDLAVVRFERKVLLTVLEISSAPAEVRESIWTMGNPNSTKNIISQGMVNCYSLITLNNSKSKIDFEVIVHTALIDSGSSGGALINKNNEIVGITFAGVFDNNDKFITGYAIPSSKIIEFLAV